MHAYAAGAIQGLRGSLAALAMLCALAQPGGSEIQSRDDSDVLAGLKSSDAGERDAAMRFVGVLGAGASSELRMALIQAASTELDRRASEQRGEVALEYLAAVTQIEDPRAIPLLAESMVYGPFVAEALAGFGREALGAIVRHTSDQANTVVQGVDMGLLALRFMVEDTDLRPLEIATITEVVKLRLTTPQRWPVVINMAMGTAVALGDPSLMRLVAEIATDQTAAARALGASADLTDIRRIQEEARRLVAGGEPYPRRRTNSPGGPPTP